MKIQKLSFIILVSFSFCLFIFGQEVKAKINIVNEKTSVLNSDLWILNGDNIYNNNVGNVGIGINNPSEKLVVSGNILADNFITSSDGKTLVGLGAGEGISKSSVFVTALGFEAGSGAINDKLTLIGHQAGFKNTGSQQIAVGYQAGYKNSGDTTVSLGYLAGRENTGNDQVALGHQAGSYNNGVSQTVVGYNAGVYNQGDYQTTIGNNAGIFNTGNRQLAFGINAGQSNTGFNQLAIGFSAGINNSGDNVIAIGYEAGLNNELNNQFILQQSNVNDRPLIQGDFASGNLGIGTTESLGKLHIKEGSAYIINHSDPGDLIVESSNFSSSIDLVFPSYGVGMIKFYDGLTANSFIGVSGSDYSDNFMISHQGNLVFSADKHLFNNKVGINIENPIADLHVVGSIRGEHQASNGQAGLTKSYSLQDSSGSSCQMDFVNGLLVESDCLETNSFPVNPAIIK